MALALRPPRLPRRRPTLTYPSLGIATRTPPALRPSPACPGELAAPPSEKQVQGFFARHALGMHGSGPLATLLPFSSPGDAFLQFILENFSSQVCTPVAPGSPLFAPSPVYIAVCRDDHQTVSLSSVCGALQFWMGSSCERLAISEIGTNVFRLSVASRRIASFVVLLGSLRHGQLLAVFFESIPSADFVNDLSASPGPLRSAPSSVTPRFVSPSAFVQAYVTLVEHDSSARSACHVSASENSVLLGSHLPSLQRDRITLSKSASKRRSPLCLLLLQPGILPRPAGPLPWPVHPARDPSPPSSTATPAPPP
jgi:hypothetical protein